MLDPTVDFRDRNPGYSPTYSPEALAFGNSHLGFLTKLDKETELPELNWRSFMAIVKLWVLCCALRQNLRGRR